jgi:hypothetical protein
MEHRVTAIDRPTAARPLIRTRRTERKGPVPAGRLSTDHKIIRHMCLITSFLFFLLAGIMALLMRVQLLSPTSTFLSDQQYNELFTMHGTIMLLLFATPRSTSGCFRWQAEPPLKAAQTTIADADAGAGGTAPPRAWPPRQSPLRRHQPSGPRSSQWTLR